MAIRPRLPGLSTSRKRKMRNIFGEVFVGEEVVIRCHPRVEVFCRPCYGRKGVTGAHLVALVCLSKLSRSSLRRVVLSIIEIIRRTICKKSSQNVSMFRSMNGYESSTRPTLPRCDDWQAQRVEGLLTCALAPCPLKRVAFLANHPSNPPDWPCLWPPLIRSSLWCNSSAQETLRLVCWRAQD